MTFTDVLDNGQFFEEQFTWSVVSETSVRLSRPPWPVRIDLPNQAEVRKKLQLLKCHKSLNPSELPPALLKDGGDLLVKELTVSYEHLVISVATSWNESKVVHIFKKVNVTYATNIKG